MFYFGAITQKKADDLSDFISPPPDLRVKCVQLTVRQRGKNFTSLPGRDLPARNRAGGGMLNGIYLFLVIGPFYFKKGIAY
jgi:hypothetical protein